MKPKHGFLLFVATCIPGCGQMYQGYMKRGFSLLLAFCAVLALALLLDLGELVLFLPLVWLYAFFDSYNLRGQLALDTAPPDAYLFGLSSDKGRLSALFRRRHSLIGWALVALGVYMLYGMLIEQVDMFFAGWFASRLYNLLHYGVPRAVITVLVILLGIWFIRGPKKPREDEVPNFTPPQMPEESAPAGGAGQAEEVTSHDEPI